jgi:peptidoglycan/xylan/chitin deacetylase (PgdA/CDA1 family)
VDRSGVGRGPSVRLPAAEAPPATPAASSHGPRLRLVGSERPDPEIDPPAPVPHLLGRLLVVCLLSFAGGVGISASASGPAINSSTAISATTIATPAVAAAIPISPAHDPSLARDRETWSANGSMPNGRASVKHLDRVAIESPREADATVAIGTVTRYNVPVLVYHRIAPASERGLDLVGLVIDPEVFDSQLAALPANRWHTITSAQLAAAMAAKQAVPPRTLVITLDDGHEDGYTHAFPILEKHGFVATFFVITGRVNRSHYLTWAEMLEMQAAGMEIGNHTVSHVDETGSSRALTDAQVMGAQDAIESQLGTTPVSFAYPFGRMPVNVVASVKAAGIEVAYTTTRGVLETPGTADALPRLRVAPTTIAANPVRLLNAYQ